MQNTVRTMIRILSCFFITLMVSIFPYHFSSSRERVVMPAFASEGEAIQEAIPHPLHFPEKVTAMPNVKGRFMSEAASLLENAGIRSWRTIEVQSRSDIDRVLQQSPAPGGKVNLNAADAVVLYVGNPIKEVEPLPVKPPVSSASPGSSGIRFFALLLIAACAQAVVLGMLVSLIKKLDSSATGSHIIVARNSDMRSITPGGKNGVSSKESYRGTGK